MEKFENVMEKLEIKFYHRTDHFFKDLKHSKLDCECINFLNMLDAILEDDLKDFYRFNSMMANNGFLYVSVLFDYYVSTSFGYCLFYELVRKIEEDLDKLFGRYSYDVVIRPFGENLFELYFVLRYHD